MPFLTPLDVTMKRGEVGAVLNAELIWTHFEYGIVTVPAGFDTDFASVPGFVLIPGIVPRVAHIKDAAVVHDYLYTKCGEGRSRKQCDKIFYAIMREIGFPRWRSWIAYRAVRLGGGKAFKGYCK